MSDRESKQMPPFTERGYLPPGIWEISWVDFWERYGYNSRHANLLSGLTFALRLLIPSGCQEVYIGGSFVTNKEKPNDIDGCFDGMSIDIGLLDPIFNDIDEQQARFGCELRMDFMSAFQGFLQKDRDGEPIGLVVLNLNDLKQTGN
jgi:hypothetical protein